MLATVALFICLLCAGCAPRSYVVLVPSPDGSVGKVVVRGERGEQLLDHAGQASTTDGRAIADTVGENKIEADFGSAIAARPQLPARRLIYFSSGTTLTPESEALIPKIVAEANARTSVDISVIGHTDTVFTTDYNEKLALQRANRVAELLKEQGLKASGITIESHGKRNLLIQTPDNTYEPRNRRVEVSIR